MCIVMVTNLKEGTKSKCEQYWPDTVTENDAFGPFTVTLIHEMIYPDFVIRNLSVTVNISNLLSFYCIQYRYKMSLMIVIH